MKKSILLTPLVLLLLVAAARAEIEWKLDIREALDEAEARGVPVFVFLARDT